jgi:two-component system, chemotaxis family, chemotaxis protein CheY
MTAQAPARPQTLDLKTKGILIVDEATHSRQLLTDICRTLNLGRVSTIKCPTEAMAMLEQAPFDFVICHLKGEIDGPKFVANVRAMSDPRINQTPIVVMKEGPTAADVTAARDAGATEFLSPPLSAAAVLHKLESITFRPRAFIDRDGYRGPDRRRREVANEKQRREGDESHKVD